MPEDDAKSSLDSIEFQLDRASKRLTGGMILAAGAALLSVLFYLRWFSLKASFPGLGIPLPLPIAPYVFLLASTAIGIAADFRFGKARGYLGVFLYKTLELPEAERAHIERLFMDMHGKVSPLLTNKWPMISAVFGSMFLHMMTIFLVAETNYGIRNPQTDTPSWVFLLFSVTIGLFTAFPFCVILMINEEYQRMFRSYDLEKAKLSGATPRTHDR